jgi:hypothetical protein
MARELIAAPRSTFRELNAQTFKPARSSFALLTMMERVLGQPNEEVHVILTFTHERGALAAGDLL